MRTADWARKSFSSQDQVFAHKLQTFERKHNAKLFRNPERTLLWLQFNYPFKI